MMFETGNLYTWIALTLFVSFIQISVILLLSHRKKASSPIYSQSNLDIAKSHPHPIWQVDDYGVVVWKNKVAGSLSPKLFSLAPHISSKEKSKRICLHSDQYPEAWFDINIQISDKGATYYATPADGEVSAHQGHQESVTALTNTFAQLSTGLAVFDKNKKLISFNPALLEITGINFETLNSNPYLYCFIDTLRDLGVIPEPTDYKSWRDDVGALFKNEMQNSFSNTWHQANGQTLHITGKPHPDGAVIFLFEDITKQTSQAQQYKSLQYDHIKAIDNLNCGVAWFENDGKLIHMNQACYAMWNINPECRKNLIDFTNIWSTKSEITNFWQDAKDLMIGANSNRNIKSVIQLRTGCQVTANLTKFSTGSAMVTFQ